MMDNFRPTILGRRTHFYSIESISMHLSGLGGKLDNS